MLPVDRERAARCPFHWAGSPASTSTRTSRTVSSVTRVCALLDALLRLVSRMPEIPPMASVAPGSTVSVVDAPGSGQAMLGRGKQKTASLAAKQIGHSAIRQNRILDAAVRLVRQGGRLVYSTCTFAEAENEAQIWRLIESNRAVPNPIDSLSRYETDD